MFQMEYLFDLDIADKALKEMLDKMGMPVPVLQKAIRNTVTSTTPVIPTQEQQEEFVKICCERFKDTDLGTFVVVNVHYAGLGRVFPVEKKTITE